MNVLDIMTAKPVTIGLNSPLREAIETMQKVGCKHLPVVGEGGHVLGIISDRDCRMALNSPFTMRERWQDEALVNTLLVRAVMTPAPITVEPDMPAMQAAQLMLSHRIGCLPVMRGETLVGIITRSDVLMAFINIQKRYLSLEKTNKNDPDS